MRLNHLHTAECRRYLDNVHHRVQPILPEPYVSKYTIRFLSRLSIEDLHTNLSFHMLKDRKISLSGGQKELALRLQKVLKNRWACVIHDKEALSIDKSI